MPFSEQLLDLILAHSRKLFFPEEWIQFDLALSKTELFALLFIERHGEATMSQISDWIGVPMSTATGVVDRLVRHGYLRRDRSEQDRRIVIVKLTERAVSRLAELKRFFTEMIGRLEQTLTADEKTVLLSVVSKALDAFGRKADDAEPGEAPDRSVRTIRIE